MDPNNGNSQGGSDAVKKLEQDLDVLTEKAKTEQPSIPVPTTMPEEQPIVVAPVVQPTPVVPVVIPEAVPSQTPPLMSQPEIKKKGSPLLIVAIILALLAVLAVVIYVFGSKFTRAQPTPVPVVTITPTVTPIETPVASESASPTVSNGVIPTELVDAVKQDAVNQSNPKVTIDKIIIGDSKVEGNYAMVAFNYTDGGGAVDWLVNTNGIWKVVTTGQEPPTCSTLKSYGFPTDFSCN